MYPVQLMNLINVLLWASGASAAVLPIIARQMAVEANRKAKQLNEGEINFEKRSLFNVPKLSDVRIPELRIPLTISFCDSGKDDNTGAKKGSKNLLKQRLKAQNSRILSLLDEHKHQSNYNAYFIRQLYEKMLDDEDHPGLTEAFKNDEINFSYIPRQSHFYCVFLNFESTTEGNKIIQKYFESGTFEEMRQLGLIKYIDIIEYAVIKNNYFVANLALEYMIAAMHKEIDNEKFDESEWRINPQIFKDYGFKHLEQFPAYKIYPFWFWDLTEKEKSMFIFYGKYNRIFANDQLRHWTMGTSDYPVFLIY